MENWQKLERGVLPHSPFARLDKADEVWLNDTYQVNVYKHQKCGMPGMLVTWLSIKRRDKEPCNDWRHFQWIKNQLVGEENEGLQIYPKESRMVDGSNQYHIWVLEEPGLMLPFGFTDGRTISERPLPNGKQRAWPKNMKPPDLEEQEKKVHAKLTEMKNLGV